MEGERLGCLIEVIASSEFGQIECHPTRIEESNMDAEKEFFDLFYSIEKGASKKSLAHVRYLYGALLPASKVRDDLSLHELYCLLKEEQEHHDTALSLSVSILQHGGSPDKVRQLEQIVESQEHFEAEKRLKRLTLRKLLAAIANDLEEEQSRNLVNRLARLQLKESPDSFRAVQGQSRFESLLAVFVRMEQQQLLTPGDSKLLCLRQNLTEMGRKDLVANQLESYDPNRPFSLAVIGSGDQHHLATSSPPMAVKEMKEDTLTSYQHTLIDAYDVMPEIPHNQWPPVKKAHYVSLALITSEEMVRTDLYSRNTIRGSVDDIIKHKEPIEFERVFPDNTEMSPRSTLIEGRPGCGKTTLMFKVTKDWAKGKILKDVNLFVLVTLRRFMGKRELTLEDILGVYCPSSTMTKELVDEISSTGGKGVVFAFDGLDEYRPAAQVGNLICDIIRGTKLPNARVFITSRPAGSHEFRRLVQTNIEIIGFLEKQVHQYIRDHYEGIPGKATSLIDFLKSHPNIGRMCYLPLHLAMLVYLYEYQTELPETETEMYKTFVLHTLFRAVKRELDPDEADDLELHDFHMLPAKKHPIFYNICRLAFEATCSQKQIFTGKEIIDEKVLPVPPSGKDFDSLGLLTVDRQIAERALPTRTYSFLHLTLQEFLSALYVCKQLSDQEQLDVIDTHGGKVHMRVVWKFYCGLSCEQKIFLNSFKAIIEQNISNRLAVLHMMHCAYESTKVDACQELLDILRGRIDVMDVTLNQSDCAVLGFVVTKAFQLLTQIDLSYCHIGPEGMAAFVEQIQELPEPLENVDTLRLRARIDLRPVGPKGAPALLTLLKKLPNLRELRLYGNQLQTDKFKILVPVIASMQNVQTLILSRNSLDENAGALVSDILEKMPLLHTFYISYNPIGSRGLVALMPGLQKCRKLKIVGLRGTSLTEDAGKPLGELLRTLPCLQRLILYQNKLRDRGVVDMLPGLSQASALIELSLVETELSDGGAIALAGYLGATKTLTEIRLYYNNLSDTGKMAVRTAVLGRSTNLVELKLAL